MRRLSKGQLSERDIIVTTLTLRRSELKEAVDKFNQDMIVAKDEVLGAIESFNEALSQAVEWRDNIVQEMDTYIDERSEKWSEGDAGQAYEAWKNEFEILDLEGLEIEFPEEIEMPEGDPGMDLEVLDEEPQ